MNSAALVPLRELAELKSGGTPSKSREDYWDGDIPWISGKTLHHTFVNESDLQVTEAGLRAGSNLAPLHSSLILVRGMSLLQEIRIGMATRPVAFNQDVKAVVARPTVNPRYLNFALRAAAPVLLDQVHQAGHGTGVLATDRLTNLPIWLPPLEEQERIAGVLGAFDDLIETNRRLAVGLVDLARTSCAPALSQAPRVAFDAEFDVIGGGTPKTSNSDYWGGDIPWFAMADLPSPGQVWVSRTTKSITPRGLSGSSTRVLPERTVILTARGTVGELALTATPMAMNQSCYGIRAKRRTQGYFDLFAIEGLVRTLRARSGGSVFDTITRETLSGLFVPLLGEAELEALEARAAPLMLGARSLLEEARDSERQRDELLPLLLSGRARVRDLEGDIS